MVRKIIAVGVIVLLGASVFITSISAQTIQPTNGPFPRGIIWSENFDSCAADSTLGG